MFLLEKKTLLNKNNQLLQKDSGPQNTGEHSVCFFSEILREVDPAFSPRPRVAPTCVSAIRVRALHTD